MNKGNEEGPLQLGEKSICQIKKINEMGRKASNSVELKRTLITKLRSIYRRLMWAFASFLRESYQTSGKEKNSSAKKNAKNLSCFPALGLKEGDTVKIRSKKEILQTLDETNRLDGCGFMDEMWQYCGSQQKVLKRVNFFYDEQNAKFLKARNSVLLEGLQCSGKLSEVTPDCDRSCYFFWREEWLEKITKN
jgi:hypothetical protein